MTDDRSSNWIPLKRIRIAVGIALAFVAVGMIGSLWSLFALLALVPAFGAGWVAFVMLRIRWQLSAAGGGWERRIHDAVAERLALSADTQGAVLDIGCGDASLLIGLLDRASGLAATGVDFWGANWDYAQSACEIRLAGLGRRATFRRMDAAQLDFPDASFDIVTSVMCFHEVRAAGDLRGPLVAVNEALRVLRPGGAFVFVDRFASAADYGDPADLDTLLRQASDLRREPIVTALGVPWPLNGDRSLGPVEIISGRKA